MPESRSSAMATAKTAPMATESAQSLSSSGTPLNSRAVVSTRKPSSMLGPPDATHGAHLAVAEQPGGAASQQEVDRHRGDVEGEGLLGRAGGDLRLAQQLDQSGHRDQRRFLEDELPDIAHAGQGEAQHLRRDDAAEHEEGPHADGLGGFDLAARYGEKGAAKDLGLVGAGDDADGERAGEEGVDADEALRAERPADRRQGGAAAEIEEIDDEEIRNAAQHRRVGAAEQTRAQRAGQLGPGAEATERQAEQEGAERYGQGHQRRRDKLTAPALGAEADQIEGAHQPVTPASRSFRGRSARSGELPSPDRRRGHPAITSPLSLGRDIELEPLDGERLDLAVIQPRLDRLVELLLDRSVRIDEAGGCD